MNDPNPSTERFNKIFGVYIKDNKQHKIATPQSSYIEHFRNNTTTLQS